MEKVINRLKIIVFSAIIVLLLAFGYLASGCDNLSSEDTSSTTDTIIGEDTGPADNGSNENVIHKSNEEITSAQKWSGTHILEGNLYIKAALEISPCTKIQIAANSKIKISDNGSIKAIGTEECPITFTSAKASPAKGDWKEIDIYKTAGSDNAFEWVIFEFGGGDDYGMLWTQDEVNIYVNNTVFRNSSTYGVYFESGTKISSFKGNKFINLDKNPIYIDANEVGVLNTVESKDNSLNTVKLFANGEVTKASLWKYIGIPYELSGNLYFKAGVEIAACNKLLIGANTKIVVSDNGSIKAIGTEECPITFTSAKASPAKGDWKEIDIYNTASSDNTFDWVILEFGGSDNYGMLWVQNGSTVSVSNTTFKNSSSYGVYFEEGVKISSFKGNKFSDLDMNPLYMGVDELGMIESIETTNVVKNTIMIHPNGEVTKAATWQNPGIPVEFSGHQYIRAAVEVGAGNTILMAPDTKIAVSDSGSFKLTGTSTSKITIKSAKSSPAAGDWYEVDIYATSGNNNIWNYVNIMHGGGNGYGQLWVQKGASVTLNNCNFTESTDCDVYIENGATVVNNSSSYTICSQ